MPEHRSPNETHSRLSGGTSLLVHFISVVLGFLLLFSWTFSQPLITGSYLAESDLYEYYLPIFLSPVTTWSTYEFGGFPAFADPGDSTSYPLFLFARWIDSWTAFAISAFVVAAAGTYAYVFILTRSIGAALFSGIAFGLSEALMERVPHMATLHVFVWLPLSILAVEKLLTSRNHRWTALGALALGNCILAGHPQATIMTVYISGLYGLTGGLAQKMKRSYFFSLLMMFTIGGLLGAVKLLPLAEASEHIARQSVSFSQFISHSNDGMAFLSTFLPTLSHDGREAPTYVGLGTLVLATATMSRMLHSWRIAFWTCISVFAILIGMGDSTPLAGLIFESVPLYDKFRIASRHLYLAAFGLAVLAGLGLSEAVKGTLPASSVKFSTTALGLVLAVISTALILTPEAFNFEPKGLTEWGFPGPLNDSICIQLLIAGLTIAICRRIYFRRHSPIWVFALISLIVVDLMNSQYFHVSATGLHSIVIPRQATEPSIHTKRLAGALSENNQRMLAIGGNHRDAISPGTFSRLWQVPDAGGYGPMLLGHHEELARMETNGSVDPHVLASEDVSLDVLAVRNIVVRDEDITVSETFDSNDLTWAKEKLNLEIGDPNCGHSNPASLSLWLPAEFPITDIALVGHLRCSEDQAQGSHVGTMTLVGTNGERHHHPLMAGINIADESLIDPDVRRRAKHELLTNFNDPDEEVPFEQLFTLPVPSSMRAQRLLISVPNLYGWVQINRITLIDRNGIEYPQTLRGLYLRDSERWKKLTMFRTSRLTDRNTEENHSRETGFTVFENLRARPRAWIVNELLELNSDQIRTTLRTSRLPNGQRFDPSLMAVTERSKFIPSRHTRFDTGYQDVKFNEISDGVIDITATTMHGGFLILSEAHYPGWKVRIGNSYQPIQRVNIAHQGVKLAPGQHHVIFEFSPMSLYAGYCLSLFGVALIVVLGLSRRNPKTTLTTSHE